MTVVLIAGTGLGGIFTGLSSDTKPVSGEGFAPGATFYETDTGITWTHDGTNWTGTNFIQNYNYALKGSLPTPAFLQGANIEIVTGLTATDGTERLMSNNHLQIEVNSITGSGTVVVTGDSINEETGVVTVADTENLTIDATGNYQTSAKWYRVTAVTIPGGIAAINYDLWRLHYFDQNNQDFRITGYKLCLTPTNATNVDFRLEIHKVQDDGSGKLSIVEIEDISMSGTTPWIVDNFHATGGSVRGDRGYNTATATPWVVGEPMTIKVGDFDTEFSSDENFFEGSSKDEGYFLKITWDNCDFMTLALSLQLIQ